MQEENARPTAGDAAAAKGQARRVAAGALTAKIRRIEQEVRPNGAEEALDAPRDPSARAADRCARHADADADHPGGLRPWASTCKPLDAVKTVRPALARFDWLSDEQKAHFNIMRLRQG